MEIPRWIPKKIVKESEEFGGIDVDDSEDLEEKPYFDKPDHASRSIHNDTGQHSKHWKKEEHEAEQEV